MTTRHITILHYGFHVFRALKTYFLVAGIIFAVVAVSHALRIYMEAVCPSRGKAPTGDPMKYLALAVLALAASQLNFYNRIGSH